MNMKTFIPIAGAFLLALSCATASDARQHAKRLSPAQSEPVFNNSDYAPTLGRNTLSRDSSCFYGTGLPELYACGAHGG